MQGHDLNLGSISTSASQVLIPVLPVFAPSSTALLQNSNVTPSSSTTASRALASPAGLGTSAAMVGVAELNTMLGEERRSLDEQIRSLAQAFPAPSTGKLISAAEAKFALVLRHLGDIVVAFTGVRLPSVALPSHVAICGRVGTWRSGGEPAGLRV